MDFNWKAKIMKYLRRSVKYFFYFAILFVIIMVLMVALGAVEADIDLMFTKGYESLWQIALMLVVISAAYPYFGFMKKETIIPGEYAGIRGGIIAYMEERGYMLVSEEGENLRFRSRSVVRRIFRMFEDDITMTRSFTGFTMEGLRKDLVRLSSGLEYKFRNPDA